MSRRPHCNDIALFQERKLALDTSLRRVNVSLRERQKVARTYKARERARRTRDVLLAMVVLLLHDSDRSWLPAFMRKRGMNGEGEELAAFDEEVSHRFLELSMQELSAMRAPTDAQGVTRLREAENFIAEHRLHTWVAGQNQNHGIAPTVGDTLQHRDELAAAHLDEFDGPPVWSVAKSARYKWASSFTKRWCLSLRKPHAREQVPLGVARQKAGRERGRADYNTVQFSIVCPQSFLKLDVPDRSPAVAITRWCAVKYCCSAPCCLSGHCHTRSRFPPA